MENTLSVLLVEDDRENLQLLLQLLPSSLEDCQLAWEPCDDFDDALKRVRLRRYDLIVTDIYRDTKGRCKTPGTDDERAKQVLDEILNTRFCPIVAFTDGSFPGSFQEGPFLKLADKSGGNDMIVQKIRDLLRTGVPSIARRLHDDLDRAAGSYLWHHLAQNWERLVNEGATGVEVLERLVRRRAAVQIGRLDPNAEFPTEVKSIEGMEFYIYPAIPRNAVTFGTILKNRTDSSIRIVLTPRCPLAVQPGDSRPRADYVLTVKALPAKDVIAAVCAESRKEPWKGDEPGKMDTLRRRIGSPAGLGLPAGRYWYLPPFLDIPALYCDLLQLESLPFNGLLEGFEPIAVLDFPFAEALQSCFARLYSAVGLPTLNAERQKELMG